MSATSISNGRPQRKQLSDQLDRLDGVIDVLAEGLNKAVADAAREGSREAVKEILTELLTNPDILTMIRTAVGTMVPQPSPAPVTMAPPTPEMSAKQPGLLATTTNVIVRRVKSVASTATSAVRGVWNSVAVAVSAIRHHPQLKRTLLIGASVGLATAVVATTNHTIAATLSGLGAAATAMAVQFGCWFRGTRSRLGLA